MMRHLQRDRGADPYLDEVMRGNLDAALTGLTDALAAGFEVEGDEAARVRSMIRVGLEFWTWERLADEGMDDGAAAGLMSDAVAALAGASATAP
jgi:hypothetical protein